MSYHEKRTVVSIISSALVLAAYCIYAFGRSNSGAVAAGDLKSWATTMLIFIGVSVVAAIIIQILFHILLSVSIAATKAIRNESVDNDAIGKSINAEMVEDEMDKLIELKSTRIAFISAGLGFAAGLVALVIGYSPVVMLNIMFISFFGGAVLEGFTQLYFYRRGIRHG
jgi:hypothetical protein